MTAESLRHITPNHIYIYRDNVLVDDNCIQITHHYETEQLSWTEITDGDEIEQWFLRRNKKHLQQMWADQNFPTCDDFKPFREEHGSWMTNWRKTEQTPQKKDISIKHRLITGEEFQASLKAANDKTSSSPSRLHYGIW
jgi:hypothetical protein